MSVVGSPGDGISRGGDDYSDSSKVENNEVNPLGESSDSVSSAENSPPGVLEDSEDIDLSEFPAPLANPDDYLLSQGVEEFDEDESRGEDGEDSEEEEEDLIADLASLPAWDVVFRPGEEPRLVVRAALLDEDSEDGVSLVESSVPLTEDDVDRLFKLAGRVEKYHSRKSKWSRRVVGWAMRRKFFAGVTAFILLFLTVMTIVNIFR